MSCEELLAAPGGGAGDAPARKPHYPAGGASHADERELYAALEARGVAFDVLAWSDASVAWARYDLVVCRTTWDYSDSEASAARFRRWVGGLRANGVRVLNDGRAVEWNLHKGYMRELEPLVPCIPSELIPAAPAGAARATDLTALMRRRGWRDVMLKPSIGGGSRACLRVLGDEPGAVERGQAWLDWHCAGGAATGVAPPAGAEAGEDARCDFVVQPYLAGVSRVGEISVIVVDGAVTHAVLKRPAAGDFRAQVEHGATNAPLAEDSALFAKAAALSLRVLDAARACVGGSGGAAVPPSALLFARVDFLLDAEGALRLLELEVTEPCLYFREPGGLRAAQGLAAAIQARLHGGGAGGGGAAGGFAGPASR